MSQEKPSVTFDRLTELEADAPTLIEGLPGHGLVAAIAVDQITKQLHLDHHGNIVSEDFPPVTSFKDGRVRDTVRVYARDDPPVMTLQSDVVLPGRAFKPLSECILEELTQEFERASSWQGPPPSRKTGSATCSALRHRMLSRPNFTTPTSNQARTSV